MQITVAYKVLSVRIVSSEKDLSCRHDSDDAEMVCDFRIGIVRFVRYLAGHTINGLSGRIEKCQRGRSQVVSWCNFRINVCH